MVTYLLSWNPDKSNQKDFTSESKSIALGEKVSKYWSVTNNKQPMAGDKFYLIKLGDFSRGIIASGVIETSPEEMPHYDEALAKQGKSLNYILVTFETIIDSGLRPAIAGGELIQINDSVGVKQHWYAENSGIEIKAEIVPFLDRLWQQKIGEQSNITEANYLSQVEEFDKKIESVQRVEQRFLRSQLFGSARYDKCCICGEEMLIQFLVAAHIKKRSECTLEEKKDYKNIIAPMCKFGCDELYERGYISVREGIVVNLSIGALLDKTSNYLKLIEGRKCLSYSPTSAKYFKWHHQKNTSTQY